MTTTGSIHSRDDSSQALPFEKGKEELQEPGCNHIFYEMHECITPVSP